MQIHSAAARGDIKEVERLLKKGVPVNLRTTELYENTTPLMVAAASTYAGVDMLGFLIENGADLHVTDVVSHTPLGMAAKSASVEKTKFLLEAGAEVDYAGSGGMTALVHAAFSLDPARIDVMKLLIEAGANVDAASHYNESALRVSAGREAFEIICVLLDAGADVSPLGWTDLIRAVAFGTLDDVKREVDKGADLDHVSSMGTAWHISLQVGDREKAQFLLDSGSAQLWDDLTYTTHNDRAEIAKWLLELGADPNIANHYKESILQTAAERGATQVVKVLLDAGADVSAEDKFQSQAISVAANVEIARLLVEAGADIDYVSGEGYTRLRYAAESGETDMVRGLLALGAGVDGGSLNQTALWTAARHDYLEIVEILLAAGANPNIQTVPDRWFPLESVQSIEVAKALLDAGADLHLTGELGDALAHQEDPEIAQFLIEAGARVNPDDPWMNPRLVDAVKKNSMQLVKLYLEAGADVNGQTGWGMTALMRAAEKSFGEAVRVLLEAKANVSLSDEDGRTALFYAAAPEGFTAYDLAISMSKTSYDYSFVDSLPDDFPEEEKERIAQMDEALAASFEDDELDLGKYGYVASDSVEVVEMLVKAGSDLNAQSADGMTPLILAASCGRPARVKALLALGADKSLRDNEGKTALDHAKEHPVEEHREEIVKLLA